jgi:hypothetical protein
MAEHVFVERFAAADAENELAVELHPGGRRRLGDDGGVDADGGTGHRRRDR